TGAAMAARKLIGSVGVGSVLAALWLGLAPRAVPGKSPVGERAEAAAPDAGSRSPVAGTFSCSLRGCHGAPSALSPEARGAAGKSKANLNEYTFWITHDKHFQAYRALFNDRSKRIARNLGIANADQDGGSKDVRCLACHTTPQSVNNKPPGGEHEVEYGVGCESCHGA